MYRDFHAEAGVYVQEQVCVSNLELWCLKKMYTKPNYEKNYRKDFVMPKMRVIYPP